MAQQNASKRQWNWFDRSPRSDRKSSGKRNRTRRQRAHLRRAITEKLEERRLLARDVGGILDANDTWSGTIRVTDDVTVPDTISLTIDPGTVIKFESGTALTGVGSIDAFGTIANPIFFTSINDDSVGEDLTTEETAGSPGDWESLILRSDDVSISHAEVRFAGRDSSNVPAVLIDIDADPLLESVTISDSQHFGLQIEDGSPILREVLIERSGSSPINQLLAADPDYDGVQVKDSAFGDHIRLRGGTITEDRTWDFDSIPVHVFDSVTVGSIEGSDPAEPATLTVAPGSAIKMLTRGVSISAFDGVLSAVGTEDLPIIFTSTTDDSAGGDSLGNGSGSGPAAGSWGSLFLGNDDNVLEHVEVRGAGYGVSFSPLPGINIFNSSPRLEDVRVFRSQFEGIRINSGNPTLRNVLLEDNNTWAIRQELFADPSYENVTAIDNDQGNYVYLLGGTLRSDRTWDYGIPINVVQDVTVGEISAGVPATLTIAPGSIVKFRSSGFVSSSVDITANTGILKAIGTPTQPIIFTSESDDSVGGDSNDNGNATTPQPRSWEGLILGSDESELSNVEVRYAGGNSTSLERAGIDITGDVALSDVHVFSTFHSGIRVTGASPTLQRINVSNPGTVGLDLQDSSIITLTDSDFFGGDTGVRVDASSIATVSGSSFVGQDSFGVQNLRTVASTANFEGNYWGDVSGPNDPSNVDGTVNNNPAGTPVSDYVLYDSFLTAPPRSLAPQVIGITRTDDNFSSNQFLVHFDRPIDTSSFTADDVTITGPESVSVGSIAVNDDLSIEVRTSRIRTEGDYTFSIGPNILGTSGLPMDSVFETVVPFDRTGPMVLTPNSGDTVNEVFRGLTATFDEPLLRAPIVEIVSPSAIAARDSFAPVELPDGFTMDFAVGFSGLFEGTDFFGLDEAKDFYNDASQHFDGSVESNSEIYFYPEFYYFAGDFPDIFPPDEYDPDEEIYVATSIAGFGSETITIPFAGEYTFAVESSGGYEFSIGSLTASADSDQAFNTVLHTFDFPAAGDYQFDIFAFTEDNSFSFDMYQARGAFTEFDFNDFVYVGDETAPPFPITRAAVTPLDESNTAFDISFPPLAETGDYEVQFRNVLDPFLNYMHPTDPTNRNFVDVSTITVTHPDLTILSNTPAGTFSGALDQFEIEFNTAIRNGSFSSSDILITGPSGEVQAESIERISDTRYRINVPRTTASGVYDFTIGPGITDLAGTPMNQDGDAVAGETDDDVYEFSLTLGDDIFGPQVSDFAPTEITAAPVTSVEVTFSEPIDASSFDVSDVVATGPGGTIAINSVVAVDADTFRVEFAPVNLDGQYTFAIGPNIADLAGLLMDQDGDDTAGEAVDDVFTATFTVDGTAPQVTSVVPDRTAEPFSSMTVGFSEDLDLSSIAVSDFTIQGISINDVEFVNDRSVTLNFDTQVTPGDYVVSVGPGIRDVAGNPMAAVSETVVSITGTAPFVITTSPSGATGPPLDFITVTFSEAIDLATLTPSTATLVGPSGNVPITTITAETDRRFRLDFAPQPEAGDYVLTIDSSVADLGGTPMDQDRDGTAGEDDEDDFVRTLTVDNGGPRLTGFEPVAPGAGFSFIDVDFDEAIDSGTVAPIDMDLSGPDGVISITSAQRISTTRVRFRFAFQSTPGDYLFTVGPNIADLSGNLMDQDGDGIAGEAGDDRFTGMFTLDTPDLQIQSLTAPDTAGNGETVTVAWTGVNDGAFFDANWFDRVVLSTDSVVGNADDIVLGTVQVTNNLNLGETYDQTLDVEIPFGIEGDYTLFVTADANDQIFEFENDNNEASQPFEVTFVTSPVDLVVEQIVVPDTMGRGASYDINYQVRNVGTATTEVSSWIDRLYISLDGEFGSGDVLVGTFTRGGSLDAGAAYTATQNITIPNSLVDDDYQLLVVVDAINRVDEPVAEDNNTGVSIPFAITAFPLPDLVTTVVSVTDPASAVSGGSLTLDYTIANNGTLSVSDSWTDAIYLSTNPVFDSGDTLLAEFTESLTLDVGESYDRTLSVDLADGISGPYYLIVVPDSNNDVSEGDGEPGGPLGSAEFTVTSFPYADLTVGSVTSQELLVGNPVEITVTWTVQNVGDGPGRTNQWFDSIVLSRDSVFGNSDDVELGRFARSIGLGDGDAYTRTEVLPVAAGTSGTFTLFVETDVDDEVFELGSATNIASPTSEVVIAPREFADLVIETVSTESTAGGLETIPVNWTVTNDGIATTDRTSWSDRVYLADNPEGTAGRVLLGSFSRFGALPVGGSYDRTGLVQIPRTADGTKYIVVETSGPYEFIFNENGNRKVSAPIELTGLPPLDIDLEVTAVTSPTEAQDSRAIEVSWTVENVGVDPADSGSWTDFVFLSPVGNPSQRISLGTFSRVDPLLPGQSYTRTELVQLPGVLGGYIVSVKTDNGRRIGESDESDDSNIGSAAPITISAQPRPDLQVRQNPLIPTATSVTSGTVIDVSWIVENFGAVETPTGGSRWSDRVYLSLNDDQFNGGDIPLTPLGQSSSLINNGSKLGVGETYTSTFAFELPRGAAADNAFIIVRTDDRNQVSEAPNNTLTGEQNNTLALPITIDAIPVPPPDLVTSNVVAPVESFDDSPVVIRYRVSNDGVGPTVPSSWTDQIWLTRDVDRPTPGRGDRLLRSVTHRGALEVGEFYENEVTVNLPQFTEGQFYITVFTDPYNRVFENQFATNLNPDAPNDIDGNNFKATPITVLLTPPADLQVSEVTADTEATGGEQVTVSWRVENRGTAPTDRDRWADGIYVSDDEFFDNSDTLVFALPHDGAIDVGEDYTETATFTLPPSAKGSHFLVRTNLDPRMSLTSEPSLLEEVEAVLKRVEEATGKPLLEVSLDDLNQFSFSELRAILAGPTNVLETVFEGPFTDNNVGAAASTITDANVDLQVTSMEVDPDAEFSGETVSLTYTVTNQGTTPTSDETLSWEDKIYVSSSPTWSLATSKLAERLAYQTGGDPLQPGASYTRTVDVAMPIGGDGTFFVHVLTDLGVGRYGPSFTAPGEGSFPRWPRTFQSTNYERRDKTNNISDPVAVDVTYREADLEISDLVVGSPADSGGLTSVQFRITNNGTRATREGVWNDVVYISTDPSLDPYDLPIASLRHSGVLSVGQSYDVDEQVLLPENINGTFYILVATDSVFTEDYNQRTGFAQPYPSTTGWPRIRQNSTMGEIAEFDDEVDNVASAQIEVNLAERPNLAVTQINVPARLEAGEAIPISFDLSNIGGGDVPDRQLPFDVQVYLSRDNTLDPRSDRLLKTVNYNDVIASGGVVPTDVTARMPRGITGPYYVITVIDPAGGNRPLGQVIESNETDNRSVSVDPILIELPPPTDLVIDSVSFDQNSVGNNGVVTINYVVRNAGDTPAKGIWDDSFYLSRDAIYTFDDRLITQTGLQSDTPQRTLAPEETYSGSVTVSLPPTLPGPYNVIGRVDVFDDIFEGDLRLNNNTASAERLTITTPELLLDVTETVSLTTGNTLVYSIDVPAGETLELTANSEGASLEMYAAYERVPNSGDFDAAFEGALGGDQRALVPRTQGGRYYILIRGSASNPIELNATLLPLQITSVSPDRLGDASFATVEVRGADFDPLATLKLVRPQFDEHIPVDYLIVDATRIVAVFDLTEAELGLYDVVVTNPDGDAANVPHRLLVEPATELDTDIGMGGPNLIGLGESGIFNVTAASLTNIDTPYVHWSINVPRVQNPSDGLIPGEALRVTSNLGIDAGEDATGQSIDTRINEGGIYTGEAFVFDLPASAIASTSFVVDVYPELPAILEEEPDFLKNLLPGQIEQLSFDFYVHSSVTPMSAEDYIAHQTQIAIDARNTLLTFDPPVTDPPRFTESFLSAVDNAITDEDAWVATYLAALADAGLLRSQDVPPIATTDRRLVGYLTSLYKSLEGGALANTFDAAETNGTIPEQEELAANLVNLVRDLAGETPDAFGGSEIPADSQYDLGSRLGTRQIAFEIRAGVPEEIFGVLEVDAPDFDRFFVGTGTSSETATLVGPTGFGDQNFLPADRPLPFQITVDQPISSGEAVRELRIVQAIDPSLDLRTFQLSDFTLGDLTVDVPAGRAAFSGELDFTGSRGFVLQVAAGVDVNTRTATWLLRAIDPATGLLIEDVNRGFLRPGQSAAVGYWMLAERDIDTGTLVESTARVFVDQTDPIETRTVRGTLDSVAPTTTFDVTPLSPTQTQVTWSAVDDAGGSGVADHSVYVSRDGGSFLAIERRTTETQLVFESDPGESLVFIVLSSDLAGNVERSPAGVFVPAYNPSINLGTPPQVSATNEQPLPPPIPPSDTPGSLVFVSLQDQIASSRTPLRPSRFETFYEPFVAEALVTGFVDSGADIGPMGVIVDPSGDSIWVTGGAGRNELYQFDLRGGTLDNAINRFTLPTPIYDVAFTGDGTLWATTGGGQLVSIDTDSGGITRSVPVTATLGLEVSPDGTQLYFATHDGISVFDTIAGTVDTFSSIRVDGMRFDNDGTLWATRWPNGGEVLRLNDRGIVVETIALDTPAEDIVFGPAGSPLEGLLIVSTEASVEGEPGDLIAIDLASRQQTPMAVDGARGEFLAVHPNGQLFLTQSGQIDSLAPTAVPLVVGSSPVDGGVAAPATRRSSITFNVDMAVGDGGVDDPASYRLIDTSNGQTINIGSATYDVTARRVTLIHAPLATGSFELSIVGSLKSVDGDSLGAAFAADFGVLADLTTSTDLVVTRTQLNRADGLVLFEATVTNTSPTALSGDVRLLLDGLTESGNARLVEAAPGDPEAIAFDLGGGTVPVGGSITRMIAIANPLNEDLRFRTRLLATALENERPEITSTAPTDTTLGATLTYDVIATDIDGPAPAVFLVEGAEGAAIEPGTAQLVWDTSGAASTGDFRIRAVDSLGGFVEQVFTVNVAGGNVRPVIVATDDVRLVEGDLLELPIAAFDTDGDAVTLSVQNLPPGAYFDGDRSVLVWQTTSESSGRYRGVQIMADDGTSSSTMELEILVLNKNQSPVISSLVDRSVREGDTLMFTINATDPEGDELEYSAVALPIGSSINPVTGRFEWTPRFDQNGTYGLTFEVSDGELTATTALSIVVDNVNGQVTIADIPRRVIYEGQPLEIFIDAVDPDNPFSPPIVAPDGTFDVAGFEAPPINFTLTDFPVDAEFLPEAQLIRWTPSFDSAGRYEIGITVMDDGDGIFGATTATETLIIDVLDVNSAPIINPIEFQNVNGNETLTIPIEAVDPEGNPISISAGFADLIVGQLSPLPEFMSIVDNGDGTASLTVTPELNDRGDYAITIEATDDGNGDANNIATGSFTLNVSVDVVNAPPVIVPVPDLVAVVGQPLTFTVDVNDLDQDPLASGSTGLPIGAQLTQGPRYGEAILSWTPTIADVGSYPVEIIVTDSGNLGQTAPLEDRDAITITVRETNDAPSVTPISIPSVAEGAELVFTLLADDPDGERRVLYGDRFARRCRTQCHQRRSEFLAGL